jgi:glucose-1-phosphate thymidylyltransferase
MKVVIPVAGVGTRLRPHTYTQPKPLMPVAGKPIIRFIVDKFVECGLRKFVFVIGYLGDKIRNFIETTYPDLEAEFVYQEHREGSGHAIWVARELLEDEEEIVIAFGDTIFEADMKHLLESSYSCIGVKKVNDPREFGVADLDDAGFVVRLVEKPRIPKSNMAIVGLYKIREVTALLKAIDYLVRHDVRTLGEIQLTDALEYLLQKGVKLQSLPVSNWFDCGRREVLLETNAMLLRQSAYATDAFNLPEFDNTIIIHPVAIGRDCQIANSIIGPNVTIGDNVRIESSIIKESLIGSFASLQDAVLRQSVIGSDATVKGMNLSLNIGDNTEIAFD